jgi:hypothetical protein
MRQPKPQARKSARLLRCLSAGRGSTRSNSQSSTQIAQQSSPSNAGSRLLVSRILVGQRPASLRLPSGARVNHSFRDSPRARRSRAAGRIRPKHWTAAPADFFLTNWLAVAAALWTLATTMLPTPMLLLVRTMLYAVSASAVVRASVVMRPGAAKNGRAPRAAAVCPHPA